VLPVGSVVEKVGTADPATQVRLFGSLTRSPLGVPNEQQDSAREQASPHARTEEKHRHEPDRERRPATDCMGAEASPDPGQAVKEPVDRPILRSVPSSGGVCTDTS
jgi:hypothetical protein